MKYPRILIPAFFAVSLFMVLQVHAELPSHSDNFKVSNGCSACHSGHGRVGTPMLRKMVPELCYDCHGMGQSGLSLIASTQVYFDSQKRYRHPVNDTARYHNKNEILPEKSPSDPRHVSCLDCHSPHISEKREPTRGATGFSAFGAKKKKADRISEICYKCHADNMNKPFGSPDTVQDFEQASTSYHPVERIGRDRSISVISEMAGKNIECTDCHSPHGSDYEFMLRYNYRATDGAESMTAYELCYKCHRRDSILSDQGFLQHKKHVVFANTSCKTCHNAHGSRYNSRLIEFNTSVVKPAKNGQLQYLKSGKEISCYLNCHGAEHKGNTIEKVIFTR